MKRKILSVLGVLMAVLMSTAALSACNKIPAGADSSGGSGESVSTEQGGEPSVSESGAESGEDEEQSGAQGENSAEDNDEKYSFVPCTYEETLAFIETYEAKEQAESYIEWMGPTNFAGEKDFVEGSISTLLSWFEDEIYAAAGEDSYNEKGQYLLIPIEIARECLCRHFGIYDFDPSDYFYSPETDSYTIHKEHEAPQYGIISMKVVSVSENTVVYKCVFNDGIYADSPTRYYASLMTVQALKDGDKPFLRLTASRADRNAYFATPEEAEASLKN